VSVAASLGVTFGIFVVCLTVVGWMFRTGYRLKS
jgi:ABC-2 type transport system permease protein